MDQLRKDVILLEAIVDVVNVVDGVHHLPIQVGL